MFRCLLNAICVLGEYVSEKGGSGEQFSGGWTEPQNRKE